jgi:putative hydrolase
MIDLHTHTFLSDGQLGPAEHIRRAEVEGGYRVLGISDHGDLALTGWLVEKARAAAEAERRRGQMVVLAGVELTHVRPDQIAAAVAQARDAGAEYVIVHGETITEPVLEGTNRAAIEAGADILAHPGLITQADVRLAAERGTRLEITAKPGHGLANGHVAALAQRHGAELIFGTDAHGPGQFATRDHAMKILRSAGLAEARAAEVLTSAESFVAALSR